MAGRARTPLPWRPGDRGQDRSPASAAPRDAGGVRREGPPESTARRDGHHRPDSPRGGTEVSYTFLSEWWERGLGREAVAAAVEWARDPPGGNPVVAVTQSANTGSRRLLEAIGMVAGAEVVEYGEPQTVYRLLSPAHMRQKSNT
ncbi:GNAT family N-acetyltransferase [Streptomyces sp. NPDC056112]|uniref:GNAT family N-acetyltransferase n=1 Tax=Streptomyces sp. NPDC056112 TaxID=3345715 RepID=UPI00155B34ED